VKRFLNGLGCAAVMVGFGYCARITAQSPAPTRVDVTVDDLPATGDLVQGMTRLTIARDVIRALKENGLTEAYGFANGHRIATEPALIGVLQEWLKAGYPLGNHTFNHSDLNQVATDAYAADIEKLDHLLQTLSSVSPLVQRRYVFRYPFLNEGDTIQKREVIRNYLFHHDYRIAPVTIDYYDWAWNSAYARCIAQQDQKSIAQLKVDMLDSADRALRDATAVAQLLFGRDIPHIVLIHINALEGLMLDTILKHLRGRGVKFITLDEALQDPVYQINPDLPYTDGLTFLEQIGSARKVDVYTVQETTYTLQWLARICKDSS
jgi:peptidoglycan/xylan/chitin deacetylase (PgdA/CDA1 family)